MNFSKIKRYIDLFFYIIFLPAIIMLVPVDRWLVKYFWFAVTLISFLYLSYFSIQKINLPQKFNQKKYWQIFLFTIIILLLTYLVSRFPYPTDFDPEVLARYVRLRSRTVWFMSLVVIGYGLSVSILQELFRQILVKRELEEKNRIAELALYKAQINPHFLFNTLNTLYGLVINHSDKAEDAFFKFSGLLKFTYSKIKDELLSVKDETEYIIDYIELQKLRLNRHTVVETDFHIDDYDVMIPPMLLITFIENAFKYGTSSTRDCRILIKLDISANKLYFKCSNRIMKRQPVESEYSVGVENTLARLQMLYPGKHKLDIRQDEDNYTVELNIELK